MQVIHRSSLPLKEIHRVKKKFIVGIILLLVSCICWGIGSRSHPGGAPCPKGSRLLKRSQGFSPPRIPESGRKGGKDLPGVLRSLAIKGRALRTYKRTSLWSIQDTTFCPLNPQEPPTTVSAFCNHQQYPRSPRV
jgi:hypothetical protein